MGSDVEFDPNSAVTQTTINFPTRDGYVLRAVVYRPADLQPGIELPLIVFYHGGGYTVGQPEHLTNPARLIVLSNPSVVVAPQYRLAPEHPFPTGINDCWDSLRWIAAHASSPGIGASPATAGFILAGISAGASMATVLAHMARDYGLAHPLTGVYIACGSNCPPQAVPKRFRHRYLSRTRPECNSDISLNAPMVQVFMAALNPDLLSPMYSSFLWPSGHRGLPPMYFQIAGREFARDESLIYVDVLREEGVDVRLDLYRGLPHVFWILFPNLKAAERWRGDTEAGIRWLLRK